MTAYEMRISDWSSDVCSSDLCCAQNAQKEAGTGGPGLQWFAGGTPVGCRRLSKAERAGGGYPVSSIIIGALAMLAEVEAFALDLCRDAPAGDRLGDREGDGRADPPPGDRDAARLALKPAMLAQRIACPAGPARRGQHSHPGA